jgi:hypothetical protein
VLTACQTASPYETAQSQGWNHYGGKPETAGDVVALGAVGGDEADIVVEGTITEVCAAKGCWMRVADGEHELFVRFQNYGFFVPRNAAGHRTVMHGTAVAQEVSVDELRHYAADAGKSAQEIAAITVPETRVTFLADSVYIEGDGLDEPHSE